MKLLLFLLLIAPPSFGQMQLGTIKGIVSDGEGEFVPFARVLVYSFDDPNGEMKGGGETDFDGRFQLNSLSPGKYNLVIAADFYGVDTLIVEGVEVQPSQITFLDSIQMKMNKSYLHQPRIPEMNPVVQLNRNDPFGRSITIESEDIRRY